MGLEYRTDHHSIVSGHTFEQACGNVDVAFHMNLGEHRASAPVLNMATASGIDAPLGLASTTSPYKGLI